MNDTLKESAGTPIETAPLAATDIAANLLGEIDWVSATEGYCECPGKDHHTSKDGHRDCIVYLDRIPTLYCVHASCGRAIEEANRKLRDAVLNSSGTADLKPRKLTAEDKARLKEREERNRIRQRATKSLPQVLAQYPWPYAQILADSPVGVQGNEPDHWRLLLQKFKPEDVVWIGNTYDSGKPEHAANFRPVVAWLSETKAYGQYVCPAAFKNSSIARSNDNILNQRFLVVESDVLSRDQVGAVFKWLRAGAGLELVAIVDTAGKSLHGWFRYPDEPALEELKLVLPALKCDPKLFTPSQPVRLPGMLRDGKFQKLIYLSSEVAHE
jgi:hypothetical protein